MKGRGLINYGTRGGGCKADRRFTRARAPFQGNRIGPRPSFRTADERATDFVGPSCLRVIASEQFRTYLRNRKDPAMHRSSFPWLLPPALAALALGLQPAPVDSACCY